MEADGFSSYTTFFHWLGEKLFSAKLSPLLQTNGSLNPDIAHWKDHRQAKGDSPFCVPTALDSKNGRLNIINIEMCIIA